MNITRTPLTNTAQKFFGLTRDPFDADILPHPDEIYTNVGLDSLHSRIRDAAINCRFLCVIGEAGSGKGLLRRRIKHEAGSQNIRLIEPEFFDMEEVTVGGVAAQILRQLGQRVPRERIERVAKIRSVLSALRNDGISVALMLDECHRLNDRVISSLKNFWEMQGGDLSRLMGIVIFGQPSFIETRLREVRFTEIRQRVQIAEMPQFRKYAADYLEHRLQLAGGSAAELFEPKAMEKICRAAHTPLALGNLANAALMEAYKLEEKKVAAGFEFFKRLNDDEPQLLAIRKRAGKI